MNDLPLTYSNNFSCFCEEISKKLYDKCLINMKKRKHKNQFYFVIH